MSRLRYNNSVGTLGGSLTSTGTTITFGVAPAWSTIVGPDYIVLVLEPPGASPSANFEVVYVTAYTAGATTATIVRGQEGTTPVSHSSGVAWMVAPTTSDFPTGLTYTPATAPPPSRAYRNTALSVSAYTSTKVPIDTVTFDPNGYMDVTGNHRYNVPVSGYYQIDAGIVSGATTYTYVQIYQNGANVAQGQGTNSGGNINAIISDVIQCNAGDYIELYVYTSGTSIATGGQSFLSVVPLTQQSIASQITPLVARAFRSAAYTATTNAWTKVPFDAVSYDTSSAFSVANSRFIAPAAGWYEVSGTLTLSGSNEQVAIYKNGVEVSRGGQGASNFTDVVTDLIQCNAGDYLELWYFTTSGFSTIATGNFFAVAQISGVPGANLAAARAYRNAALTITANTWTKVPLDTTSFDPNGYMDVATNHRYNVPTAGPYLVCGEVAAGNQTYAGIYKNGSLVAEGTGGGISGVSNASITDIVQCNAGDYLELWVYSNATNIGVAGSIVNYLAVTPLVSAVTSTPGFGSSGSGSAATNVARAYRSAALTLTANVWNKIPVDTVSFDPSTLVSTANGRINIAVTGYYQVNINGETAGTGQPWVSIYKNGSPVPSYGTVQAGGGQFVSLNSDIVQCNAGDYLEVWIQPGSATALAVGNGAGNNWISVSLIQAQGGTGNANALPAGASYQNGVINSTDLAISAISINTSTGALTFTLASAVPVIIKDASGLLIPVTFTGSTFTLIPPTLPTTSNSRVMGVEIDTNGQVSLVSGASVAGQLSTASTIEANTSSITPGHVRVVDIGVYNNAGAYNFSNASTTATQGTNWVDRRPWARGARWAQANGVTGGPTIASNAWTTIDTSTMQCRAECSGVPLAFKISVLEGSTNQILFRVLIDGTTTVQCGQESGNATIWGVQGYGEYDSITPGSHLFTAQAYGGTGSVALSNGGSIFVVEEVVRQNSNNGTT